MLARVATCVNSWVSTALRPIGVRPEKACALTTTRSPVAGPAVASPTVAPPPADAVAGVATVPLVRRSPVVTAASCPRPPGSERPSSAAMSSRLPGICTTVVRGQSVPHTASTRAAASSASAAVRDAGTGPAAAATTTLRAPLATVTGPRSHTSRCCGPSSVPATSQWPRQASVRCWSRCTSGSPAVSR